MLSPCAGASFEGVQGDVASSGFVVCMVPVSVGYDQQAMPQQPVMMWGGQPQGFQLWDSRAGQQGQQESQSPGNAPGNWNTSAATFAPVAAEMTPPGNWNTPAATFAPVAAEVTSPKQTKKRKKQTALLPKSVSTETKLMKGHVNDERSPSMISALGLEPTRRETVQKSGTVKVGCVEVENTQKGIREDDQKEKSTFALVKQNVGDPPCVAAQIADGRPSQHNSQTQNQVHNHEKSAGVGLQQTQHRQWQVPNSIDKKNEDSKSWSDTDFPSLAAFESKSPKGIAKKSTALLMKPEKEVTTEVSNVQSTRLEGTAWGKSSEQVRKTTSWKREPKLGTDKEESATKESWAGTVVNDAASEKLPEEESHEKASQDELKKHDESSVLETGAGATSDVEFTSPNVEVEVVKANDSKQLDSEFLVDIEMHNKEYVSESEVLVDKLHVAADIDGKTNGDAFEEATTEDEEGKSDIEVSDQDVKEDVIEKVNEDRFYIETEEATHEDDQVAILKADDTGSHVDSVAMFLSYRCFSDAVPEGFVYSAVEPSSLSDEQPKNKSEPNLRSMFGTARVGDRDRRDRRGRDRRSQNGSDNTEKLTLESLGAKAENAYKIRDANDTGITRDKELRRCAQSLLNKICPENIETIARRIKAEAKVETIQELEIVIELIFKKALAEPHYCETYASMVSMLKGEMPSFPNPKGGKDVTFKSILLTVCQHEFEKMPRTVETSPDEDEMELKYRIENMKGRFLANMKFIGHLFLQKLLGCGIISGIVSELIGCNPGDGDLIPEEHVVECVCELLTAIGFSLEAMPIGKDCVTQACGRLVDLKKMKKKDGKGLLSKRIQFAIQDVVDMRAAGWMKKTFKAVAKTREEVRAQQEKEENDMKKGRCVIGAEVHVAGATPKHLQSARQNEEPWQDVNFKKGGRR